MFPTQEHIGKGQPSNNLNNVQRGGSSSSGSWDIVNRKFTQEVFLPSNSTVSLLPQSFSTYIMIVKLKLCCIIKFDPKYCFSCCLVITPVWDSLPSWPLPFSLQCVWCTILEICRYTVVVHRTKIFIPKHGTPHF